LEIVVFKCDDFVIEQDYHVGLFSTLIRFFPMFDFKGNDSNIVIVTDIDCIVIDKILNLIEKIKHNNKFDKLYFFEYGNINKNIIYKYQNSMNNYISIYAIALNIGVNNKLPHHIIIDFIKYAKTTNDKLSYYFNWTYDDDEYKRKFTGHGNFYYGIDEYFINNTLKKYMYSHNIPCAAEILWQVYSAPYYMIKIDCKTSKKTIDDNDQTKKINKLLKYILNSTSDNFVENATKIDKILYTKQFQNNTNKNNILMKFYKSFLLNKKTKEYEYIFPNELYECFLIPKLFGAYEIDVVKFYNIEYDDIILNVAKFSDSDIDQLYKFINSNLLN